MALQTHGKATEGLSSGKLGNERLPGLEKPGKPEVKRESTQQLVLPMDCTPDQSEIKKQNEFKGFVSPPDYTFKKLPSNDKIRLNSFDGVADLKANSPSESMIHPNSEHRDNSGILFSKPSY